MNYEKLIEHILGNSYAYLEEYEKKEKLEDVEKGILEGLWYDLDSIKNQLEMDRLDADDKEIIREIKRLEKKFDLETLINKMQKLIETK